MLEVTSSTIKTKMVHDAKACLARPSFQCTMCPFPLTLLLITILFVQKELDLLQQHPGQRKKGSAKRNNWYTESLGKQES